MGNNTEFIRIDDKLLVRPITIEDTDMMVEWRNKPEVINNFLVRDPFTREGHLKWMETRVAAGLVRQFIILEDNGDDVKRPIGSVYIRDIDMETLTAEYGVFIGELDALGHGYGNEVVKWAVGYARDMGLKTFTLRVLADNIPAYKSYLNAGFREVDREEAYIDGRDLVHMEIKL